MSDKNLQQRAQIDAAYKWDIEAMYPEEAQWEKDLTEAVKAAEAFTRYSGHLTDSADTLYEALTEKDAIWRKLEHAFVYAAMRKDEDNRVSKYQSMDDQCGSAVAKAAAAMSFFAPELLAAPEETIRGYLDASWHSTATRSKMRSAKRSMYSAPLRRIFSPNSAK